MNTCPQRSLHHYVAHYRSQVPWSTRTSGPLCRAAPKPVTCPEHVHRVLSAAGRTLHQEVSESPLSPLDGLTVFSLAVFLAVLAQGAYCLWDHQPACDSTQNQSPHGRKKAFSLFLKGEINQAICSIKRKLNNTSLRVSKLIPP